MGVTRSQTLYIAFQVPVQVSKLKQAKGGNLVRPIATTFQTKFNNDNNKGNDHLNLEKKKRWRIW